VADRGDGSLSTLTGSPFDWGDGSPTPSSWDATTTDAGDGSPSVFGLAVEVIGGHRVYRDDGGEIVELLAEWPGAGPYRVSLVDVEGARVPSDGYCYGLVAGSGQVAYANRALDTLRVALPPGPPGIYIVRVEWQPGIALSGRPAPSTLDWTESAEAVTPIRLAARYRQPQTWSLRSLLPPEVYRAAGPRGHRTEPLLVEV
jgi:hypothetical protein